MVKSNWKRVIAMLEEMREILARYNVKDSVFCHLFGQEAYTLKLYQALHPEDTVTTEQDIGIVTLENVFLNQPYNDLGFTVGNRLLILVEAQSTWTINILIRMLLYAAQTIQNHITETEQNIYGNRKVTFPEPEFYVLYTGGRTERPETLSFAEAFKTANLDLKVRVLYDGKQGDIINQYVIFTQVYDAQRKLHGRTQKAVLETIRICKDRDVLKSYLASNEKEVVDIMMTLFNYENLLKNYILDEREDAKEEGRAEGRTEGRTEGKAEGKAEGIAIGEARGRNNMLFELVKKGLLSSEDAANSINLTRSVFLDRMNNYFNSHPTV